MLERLRDALAPYAPLPLRLGTGSALLVAGIARLQARHELSAVLAALPLPRPEAWALGASLLLAASGALLVLGAFTRWAAGLAVLLLGAELLAPFLLGTHLLQAPGLEPLGPLLFLGSLSLLLGGAGRASVDALRGRA